jgi:hypothetical protein
MEDVQALIQSKCPTLCVAYLNVCHGSAGTGLATALAAINVPATIGFRNKVRDDVALQFSRAVYRSYPKLPIDLAVREARRDLLARGNGALLALPLLFLRTTSANTVYCGEQ